MILESTEFRSYALSMTLVLFGGYCFYRLYKDFSNKNLIYYFIISALLVNLHYYTVLFVFFNFVLGTFLFKYNKKFILLNCISFLTLLPYLTAVIKVSLSSDFNTWIVKPDISVLSDHIVFYFGNIVFFVLTILFCIFVLKNNLKSDYKKIVLYNILSVTFVFICAFLFSVLIKPILFERYFCIFLPLLIINTAIFLSIDYKTKYNPIIFCVIFIFSVCMPKYENFNLFSNINEMMKYYTADGLKSKNSYFAVPDRIEYISYFKKVNKDIDLKKAIVSNYGTRDDIDLKEFFKSKITSKEFELYIPEICTNSKIKFSKDENVKTIYTTTVPVYKIQIK